MFVQGVGRGSWDEIMRKIEEGHFSIIANNIIQYIKFPCLKYRLLCCRSKQEEWKGGRRGGKAEGRCCRVVGERIHHLCNHDQIHYSIWHNLQYRNSQLQYLCEVLSAANSRIKKSFMQVSQSSSFCVVENRLKFLALRTQYSDLILNRRIFIVTLLMSLLH